MSDLLAPPRDDAASVLDPTVTGNPLNFMAVGAPSASQTPSVPTPLSSMGMEVDSDAEHRDNFAEISSPSSYDQDEDQDMSDGGVPLFTNYSQVQYSHHEVGHANANANQEEQHQFEEYFDDGSHYLNDHDIDFPDSPEVALNPHDEYTEFDTAANTMESASLTNDGGEGPTLPAAAEITQQLQTLQDGQAQGGSSTADSEEGNFNLENMDEQFNLNLSDFLFRWGLSVAREGGNKRRHRGPDLAGIHDQSYMRPGSLSRSDLNGDRCDIQGINWKNLGVSRLEARQMRRQTYRNYTNLRVAMQTHPRYFGARLSDHENFFRFRRMDFEHDIHLSHFQLRNLLAGTSRDNIFYAGRSQVLRADPSAPGKNKVVLDLTDPMVQAFHSFPGGIQISTLTADHELLVAGGFLGEYGLTNLRSQEHTRHAEGLITDHHNSITNHIQVHLSRGSSLPLAAFASNDSGLRILDVATNTFISEQKFEYAINCTAISPDQRLRVLVGDTRKILICHSETGEVLQKLDGHHDFGFACDWADDGWTVATGNQDMQIKIWDARKWTDSNGNAKPITTIAAEMAGVRKLKFSPLGSGKRVLVAAEPADFVSVIDAETFMTKQTLSFFGEIGGLDFTNNGQNLVVANCDAIRGGIMEFERCNFGGDSLYDLDASVHAKEERRRRNFNEIGLDWRPSLHEVAMHPRSFRTATHNRRKVVNLADMGAY